MSLLAVVYQSLLVFITLFGIIITTSYVAYRIKKRNSKNVWETSSLELKPAFVFADGRTAPSSQTYFKNNHSAFNTNPIFYNTYEKRRFTEVATLDSSQSYMFYREDLSRRPNSNYKKNIENPSINGHNTIDKQGQNTLDEFEIINYYADNCDSEFYTFKTKYN